MTTSTQYAVLNPAIGQYEFVDTFEEVSPKMNATARDFYLLQTYNAPVSEVITTTVETETGTTSTEVWTTIDVNIL